MPIVNANVSANFVAPRRVCPNHRNAGGRRIRPQWNAIPNATVTITGEGTGFTRTVVTNDVGQYRVTPLNPGTYDFSVKAGLQDAGSHGVVLEVGAVLEVDFAMVLGAVTETIEVTACRPVCKPKKPR